MSEWISVKERLPENETYVLVTIGIPGRQPHARSGWYQDGFFHNDNGDVWRATDIEVKAWMPLPEPYNAESEDEEEKEWIRESQIEAASAYSDFDTYGIDECDYIGHIPGDI